MEKQKRSREELLELLVVIMLGATAILTAWASWIGSIHGANQAEYFAISNNLAAEGNSEYNAGIQALTQDMILFSDINSLMIDLHFAESRGDLDEVEKNEWKLDELMQANMCPDLEEAFYWSLHESERLGEFVSPFDK